MGFDCNLINVKSLGATNNENGATGGFRYEAPSRRLLEEFQEH